MAGILNDYFNAALYGRGGILGGLPLESDPQGGWNSIGGGADEAAMAQQAREAAALRQRGRKTDRGGFDLSLLDPSDPAYAAAAGAGGQAPAAALPWLWNQAGGAMGMPAGPQMSAPASQGFADAQQGAPGSLDPRWLEWMKGGPVPGQAPAQAQLPPPAQAPIFPPGMGTMGGAAGYGAGMDAPQQLDPAQLPSSAMPTIGQGGAPMPQPDSMGGGRGAGPSALGSAGNNLPGQAQPQAAPAGPSFGDRLTAGTTNLSSGGNPLAALVNSISGFATGQRTDRTGLMLQQQQATMRALYEAGVPAPLAHAASLDREILKTIAPAFFDTAPKLQETGTDPLSGQKSFAIYKPNTQTLVQAPVTGTAGGGGAAPLGMEETFNRIEQARSAGASREQLLQHVPTSLREPVVALIEGRQVPSNLSMRGQSRDFAIKFAHALDPSFDETLIPQRQTWAKSFASSGPASVGGQIQSAGTVVKHLGDAFETLPVIESGMLGTTDTLNALNPYKSAIRSQMGDKQFLDAKGTYETAVKGIAGELERLLSGSHGAESSKHYWMERLGLDAAPSTRRAALDEVRSLMMGRLQNIAEQKDRAFGGQTDALSFLGPKEQAIAKSITAGTYKSQAAAGDQAPAGSQIPEGATATGPNGHKIINRGGKLFDLQTGKPL